MDEKTIEYLVGGKRFTEIKRSSPNLSTEDSVLYRFDKLIFGIFILIVLAMFLIIFVSNGSDKSNHLYFRCASQNSVCFNQFYQNYPACELAWVGACDQQTVPSGFTFGDQSPWIVRSWGLIVGGLLFCAFVINHFMHNRNFKFNKMDGENNER